MVEVHRPFKKPRDVYVGAIGSDGPPDVAAGRTNPDGEAEVAVEQGAIFQRL